jgi:hypothetical protein
MKAVGWIEEDGSVHWLGNRVPAENTTLFVETPLPDPAELGEPIGYTLEPIYDVRKGHIATAAFVLCSSCRSAISSMGGPKYNAVCLTCLDKLDVFNRLSQQ